MNPLIFVPSVRNIKRVWEALDKLPYDKLITKNHLESTAYQIGHNFFLKHTEYTHLVICPDDLVVDLDAFELLKQDIEKHSYQCLSGVCPVDERNVDDITIIYACIPKDATDWNHSWFKKKPIRRKEPLLPKVIFEAGFTGFACQWIRRDLAEKISLTGGCNNHKGCIDRQFAIECKELRVPLMVDPKAMFVHLNMHQRNETKLWQKLSDGTEGTVEWRKKST